MTAQWQGQRWRCGCADISAQAVTRRRSCDVQAVPGWSSQCAPYAAGEHASDSSLGKPGSSSHDPGVNDS